MTVACGREDRKVPEEVAPWRTRAQNPEDAIETLRRRLLCILTFGHVCSSQDADLGDLEAAKREEIVNGRQIVGACYAEILSSFTFARIAASVDLMGAPKR